MPMSPQERSALNASLTNAVDTLQAELEAYRVLLFVMLTGSADSAALQALFQHARSVVAGRTLLNISPDEATRQRQATLAALETLEQDLSEVKRPPGWEPANSA